MIGYLFARFALHQTNSLRAFADAFCRAAVGCLHRPSFFSVLFATSPLAALLFGRVQP
jgi:hypothetical protein